MTTPLLRPRDPHCPHADGFILRKVLGAESKFTEWSDGGTFLGLVEREPGRPAVFHRLCPLCGGHLFPVGTSDVLAQPPRSAPTN
jgi:hypothetical protein